MQAKFKLNIMSKQKMSDWMERLVERYSIPSRDEKPSKILTEEQLKNIEDGKK
tara:strand:+ start:211 stop:369 length:159 start_codon:yes stop_codon:yes gene_type:complete